MCWIKVMTRTNELNHNEWNRRHSVLLYFLDLYIVFAAYDIMARKSFGSDTLFHLYQPLISINSFITDGRWMAWFLNRILYEFGFVTTDHYYLCYTIYIMLWAGSIYQVQRMFFMLVSFAYNRIGGGT